MNATQSIPILITLDPASIARQAMEWPWWHALRINDVDGTMTVNCDHPTSSKGMVKELTPDDWAAALQLMVERAPGRLKHVLVPEDAASCDLLLQFAVYGEEVWA